MVDETVARVACLRWNRPVFRILRCLLLFVIWLAVGICPTSAAETNLMCPVLQDQQATSDYAMNYKGREVRFCCSECVMEFKKHPEIYENVLPQLQDLPLRLRLQQFLGTYGGLVIGGSLLVLLIGLRVYRWKRPQTAGAGMMQRRISPVIPLLLLSAYLGYEVYSLQDQLHQQQLEDEIHFATFYDFGYPPVPKRPAVSPRLSGSYYRGNDERSPKLFNNGNYRTAKFNVSLCDADGQPVLAGDDVTDESLFLKLEIERPPFTPDFLYNQDMMGGMFLTAQCDRFLGRDEPVADAVGLTETEPMQRWQALFPIRSAEASCCGQSRGTVYVCEKYLYQPRVSFLPRRRGGSRFHYGISFDLQIDEGIVSTDSDIYMGALYRTRKLPTWRVPMTQWFSHEPIPELPGPSTDDPDLLGITDHVARKGGQQPR